MKKVCHVLLSVLVLCFILVGCGKKDEQLNIAIEATEGKTLIYESTTSSATEKKGPSELPYKPGQMGVYVMADPDIEANSEALDSVHFDATDGEAELTRYHVSNSQHDLVKNGMQVGGFILIGIFLDIKDPTVAKSILYPYISICLRKRE